MKKFVEGDDSFKQRIQSSISTNFNLNKVFNIKYWKMSDHFNKSRDKSHSQF